MTPRQRDRKTLGSNVERDICQYYGLNHIDMIVDAEGKRQYEIKSALWQITDMSCSHNTRHGRFRLERDQHEYLRSVDGYYIFVYVTDDQYIVGMVPARELGNGLYVGYNHFKDFAFTRIDRQSLIDKTKEA